MSVREERRCPNCRALVSDDAEWCGQCFTTLRAATQVAGPAAGPAAGSVSGGGRDRSEARILPPEPGGPEGGQPRWRCPTCEHENPLDVDVCPVCGTAFAALFREEQVRPTVDPRTALIRSLILPGLGHRAVGRGADGLARGAVFAYTFITTLLILFSRPSSGVVIGMLLLFGSLSIAVYVLTAVEAYRLAQGGDPIVSSRWLLWGLVALILVSVLMATVVIATAGSG